MPGGLYEIKVIYYGDIHFSYQWMLGKEYIRVYTTSVFSHHCNQIEMHKVNS